MPKKRAKTLNVEDSDSSDSRYESTDSEEGDAEKMLESEDLSAAEKRRLRELLSRQKEAQAKQEEAKKQARQDQARKSLRKLEKLYGAADKACKAGNNSDSETESLPELRTRITHRPGAATAGNAQPPAVASTSAATHDRQSPRQTLKPRRKVVHSKAVRSSPRGAPATSATAARTSPRRLYSFTRPGSPRTPATPAALTSSTRKRRRVRTPRTPRSSTKKSRYVCWLSSESDGEERNPNWEPEEIRAIYTTALEFRSDVLNEFDNNDSLAVRHTRRARAFRAIQEAVNSVGGNNRRASHILRKMRDFKSKTKLKNAEILSQARELSLTTGQTGGKPAEPDDQLDAEEILCLDFYGIEHYTAVPGAVIRPVNDSDEDSDEVHAQMEEGVRQQRAATEAYQQAKRNEKIIQANKYGFKPIRLAPNPDEGASADIKVKKEKKTGHNARSSGACNITTPPAQATRTPPTRSSERLAARLQSDARDHSIGEQLERLWPERATPRRGLSFDELDEEDAELATPLTPDQPSARPANSTPGHHHVPFSSFRDCLKKQKDENKRDDPTGAADDVIVVADQTPDPGKGGAHSRKDKRNEHNRPQKVTKEDSKADRQNAANANATADTSARSTEAAISRFEKKLDQVIGAVTVTQSHMTAMDERAVNAETLQYLFESLPDIGGYEKKFDQLSKLVESTAEHVATVENNLVSQETVEELVRCMRGLTAINNKVDDVSAFVRVTHSQMQRLDRKMDEVKETVEAMTKKCEEVKTAVAAQGCRASVMGNRVIAVEKLNNEFKKAVDENPTNGDLADRIEAVEATCLSLKDSVDSAISNRHWQSTETESTAAEERVQPAEKLSRKPDGRATSGAPADDVDDGDDHDAVEGGAVTPAPKEPTEADEADANDTAATDINENNSDSDLKSPRKRVKVQVDTPDATQRRGTRAGRHRRK